MPRRAVIRESVLRRWARIAREEGVAIRGRIDAEGGVTVDIAPSSHSSTDHSGDLDALIAGYVSR